MITATTAHRTKHQTLHSRKTARMQIAQIAMAKIKQAMQIMQTMQITQTMQIMQIMQTAQIRDKK